MARPGRGRENRRDGGARRFCHVALPFARDVSTPFDQHGRPIVAAIPSATAATIEAAHLAPLEAPAALAAELRRFLLPAPDAESAAEALFRQGLKARRRILGDEWVDHSLASRTDFNADFQAMITRTAWAEIWSRPGLDDGSRRLIVLAITSALGCWEEFRLHVQAGLRLKGFTPSELKEVLMQVAVYAGVPAANTAFKEAGAVLDQLACDLAA